MRVQVARVACGLLLLLAVAAALRGPLGATRRVSLALRQQQLQQAGVEPPQLQQQQQPAAAAALVEALRDALQRGGGEEQQRRLLELSASGASTPWDNPFVSNVAELNSCLSQFSSFFQEPSLAVFGVEQKTATTVELDYQLSFWYPTPWRPRIIIPARALVTLSADGTRFTSVKETWTPSLADLFFKQFLPRLWDIWHLFATPAPEHPPARQLGSAGSVAFFEAAPSLVYEARWTGLAKYPGPPLLTLPGFGFTGELQTSKPNREQYLPVLPVETWSDAFVQEGAGGVGGGGAVGGGGGAGAGAGGGTEMKTTSWVVPVPTACLGSGVGGVAAPGVGQSLWAQARAAEPRPVSASQVDLGFGPGAGAGDGLLDAAGAGADEADPADATDFKVNNLEKLNIMKSVTNGAQRGAGLRFDESRVQEFLAAERTDVRYRLQPRRLLARVELRGEPSADKISKALGEIRAACGGGLSSIADAAGLPAGTKLRMKKRTQDDYSDPAYSPQVGLLVGNVKACFNSRAELAMAVYELQQFGRKETAVQVELVPVQQ